MENHHKVELLAPAGNAAAFYGAISAGADAVYLAGNQFGARAYAENFTEEELLECIRYGHLYGRRIYLTVNTLLKDAELAQLYAYLAPFYEAGLDAVIVQDLGVLRFIRTHFPGLRIHVSTQMTVCAPWGASLLKEMGAERIVPARELSLAEIVSMRRLSGLEVEAFIHGAMCYCYSGQCLFSSILGGRSGNRGRCAQPCRLPYDVEAGGARRRECYPLSLKDMCTIEHIPELIESGIDSFKIEGRLKKPEYAAGVTDIYRRCIDHYYELREAMGPSGAQKAWHVKKEDRSALSSLYVRSGLLDGYYFRHNGRDMVTLDSPAYRESAESLLASIQEKYLGSRPKLPVTIKAFFHVGSPARVVMEWGKVSAWAEAAPVSQALRQPITEENVRKQLCRLGDSAFYAQRTEISMDPDCFYPLKQINELRRLAAAKLEEQILIARGYSAPAHWAQGQKAEAGLSAGESEEAAAIPTAGKSAKAMAMPAAALSMDVPKEKPAKNAWTAIPPQKTAYAFYVRTIEQLKVLGDWLDENPPDLPWRIYVNSDLLLAEPKTLQLCQRLSASGVLYAALPYILRETDREYMRLLYKKVAESGIFRGFLARSMDGLGILREMRASHSIEAEYCSTTALTCRTDAGLYVWNVSALQELSALADGFCLPYELNAAEQRNLCGNSDVKSIVNNSVDGFSCEKIIYSRIPMMVTANCLRKTIGECQKGQETAVLKDRYRKEFPVLTNCTHCLNIIYNSVPFSLHQDFAKWKGRADLRMDFALESPEEVRQVLDAFFRGKEFPGKEYTTGHERRGVM